MCVCICVLYMYMCTHYSHSLFLLCTYADKLYCDISMLLVKKL